jgi:hypothetical protein
MWVFCEFFESFLRVLGGGGFNEGFFEVFEGCFAMVSSNGKIAVIFWN